MAQLARVKVSDYFADTGTLRLLDPKGKRQNPREHLIQLGPKANKIVKDLVKESTSQESSIFQASERMAGNRVAEICAAMSKATFDLRDIRRTCETMLAGMGISKETRAQLAMASGASRMSTMTGTAMPGKSDLLLLHGKSLIKF